MCLLIASPNAGECQSFVISVRLTRKNSIMLGFPLYFSDGWKKWIFSHLLIIFISYFVDFIFAIVLEFIQLTGGDGFISKPKKNQRTGKHTASLLNQNEKGISD